MKWISVIPIRAGSKGIKNKNVRNILGKPLYRYSVEAAIEAGAEKIFISTNIEEVLRTSLEENVFVQKRSERLCGDDTPMSEVIFDFLKTGLGAEIKEDQLIVLMQATSPLRKKKYLLDALEKFSSLKNADLMMAVTETPNSPLKFGLIENEKFRSISNPKYCFSNRQKLPNLYKPTGSFYIFRAGWYRINKSFTTDLTYPYIIPKNQSIDIDKPKDIKMFEKKIKKRNKRKKN